MNNAMLRSASRASAGSWRCQPRSLELAGPLSNWGSAGGPTEPLAAQGLRAPVLGLRLRRAEVTVPAGLAVAAAGPPEPGARPAGARCVEAPHRSAVGLGLSNGALGARGRPCPCARGAQIPRCGRGGGQRATGGARLVERGSPGPTAHAVPGCAHRMPPAAHDLFAWAPRRRSRPGRPGLALTECRPRPGAPACGRPGASQRLRRSDPSAGRRAQDAAPQQKRRRAARGEMPQGRYSGAPRLLPQGRVSEKIVRIQIRARNGLIRPHFSGPHYGAQRMRLLLIHRKATPQARSSVAPPGPTECGQGPSPAPL